MFTVSVIMPVYNNEDTLDAAIQSILKQTIYDLELILVNDGSTDASGDICDRYLKEEPLLVEVIHQNHRGAGSARNRGLLRSSGKYIYFADPINTFSKNMLEENVDLADEKDADLVVFGFSKKKDNLSSEKKYFLPRLPHLLNQEDFRDHYRNVHQFFPYVLFNKLYKRDYLFTHKIKFHKTPLRDAAFFNLSIYKKIGQVAFNREAYCEHKDLEEDFGNTFQEKLYDVNVELSEYFEGVMTSWEREDEFSDLISNEYYQAVYSELKNVCLPDCPLSAAEQEERINGILQDEKISNHLNNMKTAKPKNPYQKALMATLRNENGKGAIQLVASEKGTKKVTSKVMDFIQKLFNR